MLRKIPVIALICFLIITLPVSVYAGGYEWGGLGGRASAMGGAFIGLADDWTAIYWNPAGLAFLEGSGYGTDLFSPHVTISDGNSISNLPVAQMETKYQIDTFCNYNDLIGATEPTRFNQTKFKEAFYFPSSLGGYWHFSGFTLGAGVYTPVGYYLNWKDNISYGAGTINARLYQKLYVYTGNLSIAKKLHPRFSLGVGINPIYGGINYEAAKMVQSSGIMDYGFNAKQESEGYGLEVLGGFMYKVTNKLSLGGVYRSGATLSLHGKYKTTLTFPLSPLAEESNFTQDFPIPSTWGVGLAFRATPKLIFTLDFQRTNWSDFKIKLDYDQQGTAITNKDYSADWNDSNRYRFGIEYKPVKRWALRCGYFFDESPLPDKSVSFSNVADVDRHNIILGFGYAWDRGWGIDLFYDYAFGSRKINDVNYSHRIHAICATISYKF